MTGNIGQRTHHRIRPWFDCACPGQHLGRRRVGTQSGAVLVDTPAETVQQGDTCSLRRAEFAAAAAGAKSPADMLNELAADAVTAAVGTHFDGEAVPPGVHSIASHRDRTDRAPGNLCHPRPSPPLAVQGFAMQLMALPDPQAITVGVHQPVDCILVLAQIGTQVDVFGPVRHGNHDQVSTAGSVLHFTLPAHARESDLPRTRRADLQGGRGGGRR